MANDRIIVFNPYTHHSYQTAYGLQQAGMLDRLLTAFYYKPHSPWWAWLHSLPPLSRARAERYLGRRNFAGLDEGRVSHLPLFALLDYAIERTPALRARLSHLRRWKLEWVERWAGRIVAARRPKAVIGHDIACLETFRAAKAAGVVCILDQTTGYLEAALRIFAEEKRLQPDFAEDLEVQDPAWVFPHARAELALADWVLAPSDYVRDSLLPLGIAPERIVKLPYGVDIERFVPRARGSEGGERHGRFRLLYVGRLSQRKGIKYLLEAVKRLGLPEIELTLIGAVAGSGRGLQNYAGLYHHIPYVPHKEIQRHFQEADLFVFPSLHEGSALVVFEALASGLPVITTPNAGSVVRDGIDGFIVPIRDVEALSARIALLYNDRARLQSMRQNARARAEEHSWQHYHERLARFIAGL
jgi:glycosyltransferase involved in cell wall biosynthesis